MKKNNVIEEDFGMKKNEVELSMGQRREIMAIAANVWASPIMQAVPPERIQDELTALAKEYYPQPVVIEEKQDGYPLLPDNDRR